MKITAQRGVSLDFRDGVRTSLLGSNQVELARADVSAFASALESTFCFKH